MIFKVGSASGHCKVARRKKNDSEEAANDSDTNKNMWLSEVRVARFRSHKRSGWVLKKR